MAQSDETSPPSVPDYMLDPNAVLKDKAQWRSQNAPDYSNTRKFWAAGKHKNHSAGSLENLVENLVKNWEIEASFKTDVQEWRTIDAESYTFSVNGGPAQDAAHMLKVGTYSAIIAPNSFYSGEHADFEETHKIFKSVMPTFAWEVIEVYVGPPTAVFKWRHWGEMKKDYVGMNDKGEKIVLPAHGEKLDIEGLAVARVNDHFKLTGIEIWFDPMEMFRQMGLAKDISISTTDGIDLPAEVLHSASVGAQCPVLSSTGNAPSASGSKI